MHVIQAAEPLHRDKVPLVCWDAVEALAWLADEVELVVLLVLVDSARTLEMYAIIDALLSAGKGADGEGDWTTLCDGKLAEEVVELELELEPEDEDEDEDEDEEP